MIFNKKALSVQMAQCALAGVTCLPIDFYYFFPKKSILLFNIYSNRKFFFEYGCRCEVSYHIPYLCRLKFVASTEF